MRLTIITPDSLYEHEVDPSMEVQDVQALLEAETDMKPEDYFLSNDDGVKLSETSKSLAAYGLQGDAATIFLTMNDLSQAASSSTAGPSSQPMGFPNSDADLERMRLQALGNPALMSQISMRDPELAQAIRSGTNFKEIFNRHQSRMQEASAEKDRQIELLNADPFDVEAQKKIEELIRREAVNENMQHAMEYSPESFGSVTMLYIEVEVNGHPIKAFVDSGAQSTIVSAKCAEECGLMRLLDTRFAGVAVGVGTGRILGRIHAAQIKLGTLYLPCSLTVLETSGVDFLFGLDMLKHHQCTIDLSANCLRINNTEIRFLAEHEIPQKARPGQAELEELMKSAGASSSTSTGPDPGVASSSQSSGSGSQLPSAFPGAGSALGGVSAPPSRQTTGSTSSTASKGPTGTAGGGVSESSIETLMGLGASRHQAVQLLEATEGDVDVAASMLFS